MNQSAPVIWFTGLSGSGKSTLSMALSERLQADGIHNYILDADVLRRHLNKDLGYDLSSRLENLRRAAEVAKILSQAGVVSLCSFISPTRESRQMIREIIGKEYYIEVFVNAPLEVCEQRDVKGLYKKARLGLIPDFTGISSPFEPPEQPDLCLQTHSLTVEACTEILFRHFNKSRLIIAQAVGSQV